MRCTSGCSLHIGTSHPPCLSRRSDFQADGGLFIPAELLTEADKFMTDLVRHIAVDEVTHVRAPPPRGVAWSVLLQFRVSLFATCYVRTSLVHIICLQVSGSSFFRLGHYACRYPGS